MLHLPPPNSARVVAAHLASVCRKLMARTTPRDDCAKCINGRTERCEECKGEGERWEPRHHLREMKWIGKTIRCDDCDGRGSIPCTMCEDDDWERATVMILGVFVAADLLLEAVMKQADVFTVVMDDGKIWLPKCAGIPRYKKTLDHERVVARIFYDTRQVPLFDGTTNQNTCAGCRVVWTGSFNFTKNAVISFENAVIIRDDVIAKAFFEEFNQVAAMSEPLDWEDEYVSPEWRIGT